MKKQRKTLTDFLTEKGKDIQIKSLELTPNKEYVVKPSAYNSLKAKVDWVIALLDDIYEIEQTDDEVFLVKKNIIK